MKSDLLNRAVRSLFPENGEQEMNDRLDDISNVGFWPFADSIRKLLTTADAGLARFAVLQQITVELSGDVISDWNFVSGYIETGKNWKTLLGYSDTNALGDRIDDWKAQAHPEDLTRIMIRITALAKSQANVFRGECRLRHKNGDWRRISIRGMLMARDSSGNPARMLMLQRDVTAFREAEALALEAKAHAEEANRARGAFLANMSHEIRTPMNAIIGMTELALDTPLNSEQRHYLSTVKSSAEALLTIINDILDFSKIEAGKLNFEAIPFNFRNIMHEAVRTLAVNAHKKNLELLLEISPEIPPRLIGDPTRLRQIIINLLGNAIKFTEEGEVIVSVEMHSHAADVWMLHFKIRDTGVGIPADRQEAIFEAFSQVDDSTTRKFGGTGLGLTICSSLVQLMHGEIWVESELGKGSTFHFTGRFPIEPGSPVRFEYPQFNSEKILLLAANASLQGQFQRLAHNINVDLQIVTTYEDLITAIIASQELNTPYHCVFIDAKMPAPCGMILAEDWAKEHGEPLVMILTTENQRQDLDKLRQLNLSQCLIRPFTMTDVTGLLLSVQNGQLNDLSAKHAVPRPTHPVATKAATEEQPAAIEPQEALTQNLSAINALFTKSQGIDPQQDAANEVGLDDLIKVDPTLLSEQKAGLDILLVEDNPINQDLARRLLEKQGHVVTIANNGKEALDIFEKARFRYIFMDMQMPVMGGLEATEAIRSLEMRASWISAENVRGAYIIAMTANAMDGDRERCLQSGMNDYITKPIRPDVLREALERAREVMEEKGDDEDEQSAEIESPAAEQARTQPIDLDLDLDMDHHDAAPAEAEQAPPAQPMQTQPAPVVEEPVINIQETINDLGDMQLVKKMAGMLLKDWDMYTQNIESSVVHKNSKNLQLHVHTIKSLLSLFHADLARDSALELETVSKAEKVDWQRCQQLTRQLLQRMKAIRPIFDHFVSTQ